MQPSRGEPHAIELSQILTEVNGVRVISYWYLPLHVYVSDVGKWTGAQLRKLGPAVQGLSSSDLRRINKKSLEEILGDLGQMANFTVGQANALIDAAKEAWGESGKLFPVRWKRYPRYWAKLVVHVFETKMSYLDKSGCISARVVEKTQFCLGLSVSIWAKSRANARNVSYTPNLTSEKRTISTLVDQTRIQLTRQRRKKNRLFFEKSLPALGQDNCISPKWLYLGTMIIF